MTWKRGFASIITAIFLKKYLIADRKCFFKTAYDTDRRDVAGYGGGFYENIKDMDAFRQTKVRLERTMKLLYHYDSQIETLLNINMNLYSYRGNEVIKALTVFTVLVTPITVFGALWE